MKNKISKETKGFGILNKFMAYKKISMFFAFMTL